MNIVTTRASPVLPSQQPCIPCIFQTPLGCIERHQLSAETKVIACPLTSGVRHCSTVSGVFCINGLLFHTHWDERNKAKAQITKITVKKIVHEETKAFSQNFLCHSFLPRLLWGAAPHHRCSSICHFDIWSALSKTRGFSQKIIFLCPEDTGPSG